MTKELKECLKKACLEYKGMVSQEGPDGLPGLLNTWTEDQYYDAVAKNIDEFTKLVLEHPFFDGKGYKSLVDIYEKEKSLFLYCLQNFLNDKFVGSLVSTSPIGETIEVNPDTMEPVTVEEPSDDEENKKNFVKEVLDGVPKKKYLKEFLTDPRSYKQWRDDVDRCLLYMDWEKIHRVMKKLKWKWFSWVDEEYNEHTNTTPSAFGLREHVKDIIATIEEWVMNHPEEEEYRGGTGGFEYEMYVCDPNVEIDDYDNRVRFAVRFVLEEFDNGM
jgi:hypothetical protein